jgi:hypothetical protein
MAKIPETGPVTIAEIAAEWEGPEDLAELSKKTPLNMSGTEEVSVDDFRGKVYGDPVQATGGTITDDGVWKYHTFTSNDVFEITKAGERPDYEDIDVLIIAGGGGNPENRNGGGGAGGMVEAKITSAVGSLAVVVGAGGTDATGQDSSVEGLTVAKGGGGGGNGENGVNGGSGSGGRYSAGSGTSGQGTNGGVGGNAGSGNSRGGGGGAGGAGRNSTASTTGSGRLAGGTGGAGKASLINGVIYCGGGAGKSDADTTANPDGQAMPRPKGGTGGGGNGEYYYKNANGTGSSVRATSGSNYGSGGGGGSATVGYQGIVIFRYRLTPDSVTRKAIPNHGHAPAFEPLPELNPATHRATPNMIDDPNQETIGWTVVELTDEEKAAYAKAQEEMEE